MSESRPVAGELIRLGRECEAMATYVLMLEQRRYADGQALRNIWTALHGTPPPEDFDAQAFSDSVCTLLDRQRQLFDLLPKAAKP